MLKMVLIMPSQELLERGGREERPVDQLGQEWFPEKLIARRAREAHPACIQWETTFLKVALPHKVTVSKKTCCLHSTAYFSAKKTMICQMRARATVQQHSQSRAWEAASKIQEITIEA